MLRVFKTLLVCPACGGALSEALDCDRCDAAYDYSDGIINLRRQSDARTEIVRRFYSQSPFPGYWPHETLTTLRARAERSEFARLLDEAIRGDASIAEIGCGTGQMSLYLARADRIVVGADISRPSLLLAAAAARRFGLDSVQFVETDLQNLGLRPASFDVVYCSGVLHHTPDPRAAFGKIALLAKPGGVIFLGLYNAFARIPLRVRRVVARLSRYNWIPLDPVLNARQSEPERKKAWLEDQYRHPEEHRHTFRQVRDWFSDYGVQFLRTYPSAMIASEPGNLLSKAEDDWGFEAWLSQLGWMVTLGHEGGLFVTVGRRNF